MILLPLSVYVIIAFAFGYSRYLRMRHSLGVAIASRIIAVSASGIVNTLLVVFL